MELRAQMEKSKVAFQGQTLSQQGRVSGTDSVSAVFEVSQILFTDLAPGVPALLPCGTDLGGVGGERNEAAGRGDG
jgi:hypothetical protein